jgi:hypothetical protein
MREPQVIFWETFWIHNQLCQWKAHHGNNNNLMSWSLLSEKTYEDEEKRIGTASVIQGAKW